MNCQQFELIGPDVERGASLSETERAAALRHAASCPRCAALLESWQAARRDLQLYDEATSMLETPPPVEMRLLQEFRVRHRTGKVRPIAVISAWALAAAAVLFGVVNWNHWRKGRIDEASYHRVSPSLPADLSAARGAANSASESQAALAQRPGQGDAATLTASNEWSGFTLLPGVLPADTDDAEIFRVRMQRGALESLGLPVNEERAADWIQVDVLVGTDGSPQAVRLPQEQ